MTQAHPLKPRPANAVGQNNRHQAKPQPTPLNPFSRLPKWIQAGKNREAILKEIAKVRASVCMCPVDIAILELPYFSNPDRRRTAIAGMAPQYSPSWVSQAIALRSRPRSGPNFRLS